MTSTIAVTANVPTSTTTCGTVTLKMSTTKENQSNSNTTGFVAALISSHDHKINKKQKELIMTTVKQLSIIEQRIYKCSSELTGELEILGNIASEILGFEVIADICGGAEIEFRKVGKDGFYDAFSCIRMEDLMVKLKETKQ